MGEVVHQSIEHIADKFRFRAHLSLAGIGIAGGLGLVGMIATVRRIDGDLAVFMGSVAAAAVAVNMITNWGASEQHGELACLAADGHERLNETLSAIERMDRETSNALVVALDELRNKRDQRDSG